MAKRVYLQPKFSFLGKKLDILLTLSQIQITKKTPKNRNFAK